jgi:hypothetical protein
VKQLSAFSYQLSAISADNSCGGTLRDWHELERDEREHDEQVAGLRAAIEKGIASGIAEPGTFSRIRSKYGLPPRAD